MLKGIGPDGPRVRQRRIGVLQHRLFSTFVNLLSPTCAKQKVYIASRNDEVQAAFVHSSLCLKNLSTQRWEKGKWQLRLAAVGFTLQRAQRHGRVDSGE